MKCYEVVFKNCTAVVQLEAKNLAQAKKHAREILEHGNADIVEYDLKQIDAQPFELED